MDVFRLGLRLDAAGLPEVNAALDGVSAKAGATASNFAAAEVSAKALGATTAQLGGRFDALNQSLAAEAGSLEEARLRVLELDEGERLWNATMTESAVGAQNVGNSLQHVNTNTRTSTAGLNQVARGMAFMGASAIGANRFVGLVAMGLLTFGEGIAAATAVLVVLAAVAGVYELLTEAERKESDAADAAYKKFSEGAAATDNLTQAVQAATEATKRLGEAQDRIKTWNEIFGKVEPPNVEGARMLGLDPNSPLVKFMSGMSPQSATGSSFLGPGAGAIAQLVTYLTLTHSAAEATDAAATKIRAENAEYDEAAKILEQYAAKIREQIDLHGTNTYLVQQLTAAEQGLEGLWSHHVPTLDQLNRQQKTTEQDTSTLIGAARAQVDAGLAQIAEHTNLAAAHKLVQQGLRDLDNVTRTHTLTIQQQTEAINLHLQARRGLRQETQDDLAAEAALSKELGAQPGRIAALVVEYDQLFAKLQAGGGRDTLALLQSVRSTIAAPFEALIQQGNLAVESVKTLGANADNVAALRVAMQALVAATSDDNLALLKRIGLEQLAIQLEKARATAVTETAHVTEAIAKPAALTFPGVQLTAEADVKLTPKITWAQPGTIGAQLQNLFRGELGSFGVQAGPAIDTAFDGLRARFDEGMTTFATHARTRWRIVTAELQPEAVNLVNQFRDALQGGLSGLAAGIGTWLGDLFKGTPANLGAEVLRALGSIFTRMGEALITASKVFEALAKFLSNPLTAGPAMAIAGAALVALGATLGAIATGSGGGGGGASSSAASTPIRVVVVDNSSTVQRAGMVGAPQTYVYAPTNIGVTDPVGQRQLARMQYLAGRRNLSTFGG